MFSSGRYPAAAAADDGDSKYVSYLFHESKGVINLIINKYKKGRKWCAFFLDFGSNE